MQYNIYQIPSQTPLETPLTGKNKRNILIVLENSAYQSQSDLLRRIMQSVGLDLETDCLVLPLLEPDYIPFHKLQKKYKISDVLVFGEFMKHLGIQARIPANSPFTFSGAKFLRTYPLPQLISDQAKKRKLWNALKQMFPTS